MAILERDNENWNALASLIEQVGTANVLYAIASINREKLANVRDDDVFARINKTCGIVENAANAAARHCPYRTRQVA